MIRLFPQNFIAHETEHRKVTENVSIGEDIAGISAAIMTKLPVFSCSINRSWEYIKLITIHYAIQEV